MFKVDLPLDPKEQARIDARRNREEQRKSRIFDAKTRTTGMDYDALTAQIEERKQREAEEKEFSAAADAEMVRQAKIMELLYHRQEQDRRAIEKADLEFRATQQLAATRREYDLNDPTALRSSLPARVGDDDARLGAASLQVFQGEDLTAAERKKMQAEQQRQWLAEQKSLERRRKEEEEHERKCHELQQLQLAVHQRDLSAAEETTRQRLLQETLEYNKALAEARASASKSAKERELEADAKELIASFNSDLLSENPDVAAPAPGATVRVLSDRYKGMSEAERATFRRDQLEQIEATRRAKQDEAAVQALQDRQSEVIGKARLLSEREVQRQRQEAQRAVMQENAALAEAQRARREKEKADARNAIGADFHSQFNTSSR